jgi:ferric-dicitrate binding protein FerR (iron transport regulator)
MLLKNRYIGLLILFMVIIFSPVQASSGEILAFGEIKAAGGVQMVSSTGKWVQVMEVYPLLKSTKLRTNEGVVFITTGNGSRVDLSKQTEAEIGARDGSYKINLEKGTLSFDLTPSTALTIITKDATISVARQTGDYYSLVAGVGATGLDNIQGMVFVKEGGTFVRSIQGKINVAEAGLQTKVLNTGESLLIAQEEDDDDMAAVYPQWTTGHTQGLVLGAFFTTATITAFEAFRGGGVASPSGF